MPNDEQGNDNLNDDVCDKPGDPSCWKGFKVRIDKADRDEFTVYRWGELENGQVVRTFEEGDERFGPLEDRIDQLRPDPNNVPAPPEWWLQEWRSIGSMAQRPRASVIHPAIDRELRYPAYQLVGICRAIETSDVLAEITDFDQNQTDLFAEVAIRSKLDDPMTATTSALRHLAITLIAQPRPPHSDHPLCDCLKLQVKNENQKLASIKLDGSLVKNNAGLVNSTSFSLEDVAQEYSVTDSR